MNSMFNWLCASDQVLTMRTITNRPVHAVHLVDWTDLQWADLSSVAESAVYVAHTVHCHPQRLTATLLAFVETSQGSSPAKFAIVCQPKHSGNVRRCNGSDNWGRIYKESKKLNLRKNLETSRFTKVLIKYNLHRILRKPKENLASSAALDLTYAFNVSISHFFII